MALAYFDTAYYLRMNKDVAAVVAQGRMTAEEHYIKYGASEKRNPNGYFDANYYLSKYTDVATAVSGKKTTAYDHFLTYGIKEARDPSSFFDSNYYLKHNPNVGVLVYRNETTPFEHFTRVGQYLGLTPSPYFDQANYLSANPDVRDAVSRGTIFSAYDHFVNYGIAEGRNLGNGINLSAFRADKTFTDAIYAGKFSAAFARVAQVAPFLGSYSLPSDAGIDVSKLTVPVDFTPVTGQLLYIPVGLDTSGKTLPGFFISASAPKLVSSTPVDGATGADVRADIVLTFNKEVELGASGSAYLYKADGTLVEVFTVKSAGVKASGTGLTFNPTDDLGASTGYVLKIDPGFVKDKNSNNFPGLTDSSALDFSTGVAFKVTNAGGQITVAGASATTVVADLAGQKVNGVAVTGNPASKIDLSSVSLSGAKVTGGTSDDVIVGTPQADTIDGGEGFDTLSGGAGANSFVFTATATKGASDTKFDTIADWRTGTDNRIDFSSDLTIGKQVVVAGPGVATISAKGVATFGFATASTAERLAAVEAALKGTDKSAVIWQDGSDAFVFISDGSAGVTAGDVLIKLVGVTVGTGLTLAAGDIAQIG